MKKKRDLSLFDKLRPVQKKLITGFLVLASLCILSYVIWNSVNNGGIDGSTKLAIKACEEAAGEACRMGYASTFEESIKGALKASEDARKACEDAL